MKIISYNVNGIRSAISKGLIDWLIEENPDVVCFQEVKAAFNDIPEFEFQALGYKTYWHTAEKKGYSGVGIISKLEPTHVEIGMGIDKYDKEGRVIRADFGDLSIMSVYHPSGSSGEERQGFKFEWLKDFDSYIKKVKNDRPKLVISGDYNICHKAVDIHNPISNSKSSGFLPEEREWMEQFIESGFVDSFRHFNSNPHNYSWWSFRSGARSKNLGWRIDYHLVTDNLKDKLRNADTLMGVMHSDHCPVLLELDI